MTIKDIKKELDARGWSYADLAKKICMSEAQIKDIMRGKAVLRKTFQHHLSLLFSMPEMAVLVYKINLTEKQVEDLTAGEQFPATEEGQRRKEEALKMVLRHNAEKLAAFRKGGRYDEMLQQIYDVIDANRAAKEAAEKEQNGGGET